jgi:hypothetical protein
LRNRLGAGFATMPSCCVVPPLAPIAIRDSILSTHFVR